MAANTVTVGDVTTAGQRVGRQGKGQTPHFLTDTDETACTGKPATPADDFNAELAICKTCAKLFTAATNNTEESDTMAKNTETEAKPTDAEVLEQVTTDVRNMMEVLGTLTKADSEKLIALDAQANAELLKISANKRAGLRMEFKNALAEAQGRTTTTAVARREETTSLEQVEGVKEIIDHNADLMAKGIRSEVGAQEAAKVLAESILDARLRISDKKGRPDLKGTRQVSKDLTNATKEAAANKLVESGFATEVADVDDLMDALQSKITYQMSAVLPAFVRTLDDSPEQFAELFPMLADKVTEDNPASEVVFKEYNITKESQAERAARKRRERNALAAGGTTAIEGGNGDGGEGEGDGEGAGASEEGKTQFEKDSSKLDKMGKDLVAVLGHVDEYDDEQREALRKKITDALGKLSEALTKI